MLRIGSLLASGALMLGSSVALADIHVQHLIGANWSSDDQTLTSGPTVNVTINDTTSGTYRVFVDDPTSEDIGVITINSQSTGTPTLFVGTGRTTPTEDFRLDNAGCRDLAAIVWSGGKPRLQCYVYRNVTDDISMWRIFRIDVGNELQGNVTHDGGGVTTAPRMGFVGAYRTVGSNAIVAEHGDIHRVQTQEDAFADVISELGSIDEVEAGMSFTGTWHGDVLAINGTIGSVINDFGGIGSGSAPITHIEAKNGITSIRAADDIWAVVKANANGVAHRSVCWRRPGRTRAVLWPGAVVSVPAATVSPTPPTSPSTTTAAAFALAFAGSFRSARFTGGAGRSPVSRRLTLG